MLNNITYFKNLYDQKPFFTNVAAILNQIKGEPRQIDLINQIRKTSDKEERNELKKQLGVICFCGKFSERKVSALKEYSRLVILDFDNCNVGVKKQELILLPYVHACWLSPSGDGLKALVRVSSDSHLSHFRALTKEIKGVDESGKDLARACFMSYDKELYINEHSDIYAKVVEQLYNDEQKMEKLKVWLDNKGDQFVSGNRNNFLVKLAGAANRFGLSRDFVEKYCIDNYVSGDFRTNEAINVVNRMYNNYTQDHATVSFDEPISEAKTKEILSSEIQANDIIYLKDVEQDMLDDYDKGTPGGRTSHYPSMDAIFRPLPGDLNVLSGIGGYGKSCIQQQFDLVAAVMEKEKSATFGPENFPPTHWYKEIVRSVIGKPLEPTSKDRMTREEYKRGMDFVREHFFYIYPDTLPTPDYLMERFVEAIIKHGVKRITLDPWNQLLHIMQKRDDIYLSETLSRFERFAQQQGVFLTIIAHPNRVAKKADGNLDCPDIMDLNGGPVWNARTTNMIVYHRPFYGTDKSDPTVEFHSKKIKRQMISGIPGFIPLDYDRKTGRFYDGGYSPLTDFKL